jgi:O-succinylbenzoate synthase
MGARLAALIGSEYASGLGTAALLAEDVTDAPLIPVDGEIAVGPVVVSHLLLDTVKASDLQASWWSSRLQRLL